MVAPLVGVWIEIGYDRQDLMFHLLSLPSWECGLKFTVEMNLTVEEYVAPLVGVWIEIYQTLKSTLPYTSLPSWECGLKFPSLS